MDKNIYHSFSLAHANVWESMGRKSCSNMQFIKRHFLLQVVRIHISTTSHARIFIRYYKSRKNSYQVLQVMCATSESAMKIKGSYDKIIITIVVFSSIALYNGDTYTLTVL